MLLQSVRDYALVLAIETTFVLLESVVPHKRLETAAVRVTTLQQSVRSKQI